MIEAYKVLSGLYDPEVSQFLLLYKDHIANPDKVRGHSKKLLKRKSRIEIRKHSFGLRIVNKWNILPESSSQHHP